MVKIQTFWRGKKAKKAYKQLGIYKGTIIHSLLKAHDDIIVIAEEEEECVTLYSPGVESGIFCLYESCWFNCHSSSNPPFLPIFIFSADVDILDCVRLRYQREKKFFVSIKVKNCSVLVDFAS